MEAHANPRAPRDVPGLSDDGALPRAHRRPVAHDSRRAVPPRRRDAVARRQRATADPWNRRAPHARLPPAVRDREPIPWNPSVAGSVLQCGLQRVRRSSRVPPAPRRADPHPCRTPSRETDEPAAVAHAVVTVTQLDPLRALAQRRRAARHGGAIRLTGWYILVYIVRGWRTLLEMTRTHPRRPAFFGTAAARRFDCRRSFAFPAARFVSGARGQRSSSSRCL